MPLRNVVPEPHLVQSGPPLQTKGDSWMDEAALLLSSLVFSERTHPVSSIQQLVAMMAPASHLLTDVT